MDERLKKALKLGVVQLDDDGLDRLSEHVRTNQPLLLDGNYTKVTTIEIY